MNTNPPTLRQLPDGRWFTKWAGKKRYFGRDAANAAQLYADSIADWQAWRDGVQIAREATVSASLRVVDVAELFLANRMLEGGQTRRRHYASHTKRFVYSFREMSADNIKVNDLHTLKTGMLEQGFSPKTINHDISAVKTMLTWASDLEYIGAVNLRGCKAITLGPPPDKTVTKRKITSMIRKAPEPQRPWLAVNYLTATRPSEVVKIVNGHGDWTDKGVFRLHQGKTDYQTRQPRHIVFSDHALAWLKTCEPKWSRLDSYGAAVRRVCGPGWPHPLRHSAASHLFAAGVDRHTVDLILGHLPARVSRTYNPIRWRNLRKLVARITLPLKP